MTPSPTQAIPHYTNRDNCCAFCNGNRMKQIIDFGSMALAGGFLTEAQVAEEQKYPMRLFFCEDCYGIQIPDIVAPDILFKNYFYHSSAIGSLREHFIDYATEVTTRFLPNPATARVLEFGSNDGVLLRPLVQQKIGTVVGVDPATNVFDNSDKAVTFYNDFFSSSLATKLRETHGGGFDLVMANNVYAHIPDIQDVTRGVQTLLADDGVFVFEVHYLGKILNDMQYDMIYHEHLYYYSLLALQKHFARYDMTVFDIKQIPIHAGSIRCYVAKKTSRHAQNPSLRVTQMEAQEREFGFDRFETYQGFAEKINKGRERLMDFLEQMAMAKRTVYGYGASGRANTIMQYCGINHTHMQLIIDDAPAKHGYLTPGTHFKVHPPAIMQQSPPDFVLLLAWGYFNEIAAKRQDFLDAGGAFILPLPEVRVVYSPKDMATAA